MNFDEEKWSQLVRQWDDEDNPPDVISGAAESVEPEANESVMTLPEMDFSGPVETAETRTSVAPAVASSPAPSLGTSSKPMQSSTPSGGASSPDWAELGRRLKIGNMSKASSQAYESQFANAGATGAYRPNPHAGEVGPALVKGDLDILGAKQGTERHDAAMSDRKATAGVKAAMDDPNSLQSQKARDGIRNAFPSVKLPSGFDNWSANDIQKFLNGGSLQKSAERDARAAQQQEAAAAKAQAGAAKSAEADAKLKQMRKTWASEFKKAGIDPDTATADDLKVVMQMRGQNLTAESLRHREGEDERKRGEDIPPDYEVAPGGNPGPDSRKKFTALVASSNKLKGLTKRMRDMTANMTRLDRAENYDALNQLATQIGIEGKNVAELGALSGPDMALMDAMVQNPTSAWNMFRDSNVAKNMNGLDSWANDSVKAGEKSYGLRRKGGGSGMVTPSGKPYAKKQKSPSTGRVRYLDAAGAVIEESDG